MSKQTVEEDVKELKKICKFFDKLSDPEPLVGNGSSYMEPTIKIDGIDYRRQLEPSYKLSRPPKKAINKP